MRDRDLKKGEGKKEREKRREGWGVVLSFFFCWLTWNVLSVFFFFFSVFFEIVGFFCGLFFFFFFFFWISVYWSSTTTFLWCVAFVFIFFFFFFLLEHNKKNIPSFKSFSTEKLGGGSMGDNRQVRKKRKNETIFSTSSLGVFFLGCFLSLQNHLFF